MANNYVFTGFRERQRTVIDRAGNVSRLEGRRTSRDRARSRGGPVTPQARKMAAEIQRQVSDPRAQRSVSVFVGQVTEVPTLYDSLAAAEHLAGELGVGVK